MYLKSIKNFFTNDDDFNWNYGIANAGTGDYKEAEEALVAIQSEKYRVIHCLIKVRWLFPEVDDKNLHHERKAKGSMGTVYKYGDFQWIVSNIAVDRKWLLQNGPFLFRCESLWHFRKTGLRQRVRRSAKRLSCRSFPNGHRVERELRPLNRSDEYALKHGTKSISGVHHESNQEVGQRQ